MRAVVTDKQGKVIDGLTKDDFELLENNKPQPVSFFNFTRIAGRGATPTAQPKTAEEITGKTAAPPARSVLLFADTLHLEAGNLLSLKQSLRGFKRKGCINHELLARFRLPERVRFQSIVLRFRQSLVDDVDELTFWAT